MSARVTTTTGRAWPIHPLLLAAYAVLFLFAQNLAEVGLRDAVPPLGRSVIGAALALAVCGLLYRDLRRGALVASALVAAFFGYGHATKLLGPDVGREPQLAGWALLVVAAAVAAWRLGPRRIASLTVMLDVVAGALVAMTLVNVVPSQVQAATATSAPLADRPAPDPSDPDIWFLVFDRYGSTDAIELLTGVRNDLPDFLRSRGFTIIEDARANYGRTAMSLASTFQMDYLDGFISQVGRGSTDFRPLNGMLQDHPVGRQLRGRGYRLIHVGSWWGPTAASRVSDEAPVPGRETDFEVLLRDTTILPVLDELNPEPEIIHSDAQHREYGLFQFRELGRLRHEPGPKFVFAHILLPHPPYVFDEAGDYPSEAERGAPEGTRYAAQLAYTNRRIRELVDELLDAPADRRPIIVLAADEGPYPRGYGGDQGTFDWEAASPEALRIKYGILDAFYLPDSLPGADAPELPAGLSPVNTFRVVFDRAFGADLPLLPDRSFTSRDWKHPYDLTDITDRLPPLAATDGSGGAS